MGACTILSGAAGGGHKSSPLLYLPVNLAKFKERERETRAH